MRHLYIFHHSRPEILGILDGLGKNCLGCGHKIESRWEYTLAQGYVDYGPIWQGQFHNETCLDCFISQQKESGVIVIKSNGYGE